MRNAILDGELNFPGNALFEKYPDSEEVIKQFWKSVWFNFLNGCETNGLHWYERLNIKVYNDVIRRLSHHGWVTSHSLPGRKWASIELNPKKILEFVTKEELEIVKAKYKYAKYLLECNASTKFNVVKQNGEYRNTGLERKGFMESGNTVFGFDMGSLAEHEEAVLLNLNKSMDKIKGMYPDMVSSISSYDEVSRGIYEYHKENPTEVFTTGDSLCDSRGRAISSSLSKVFNPISNKDARSALVITYPE